MPHGIIETRPLGDTGERVSCIGLGGSHIGSPKVTDQQAVRLIQQAVDGGITFLDNSWDYHEGRSERLMGKALKDGYRSRAFVMTKFDGRSKTSAIDPGGTLSRRARLTNTAPADVIARSAA